MTFERIEQKNHFNYGSLLLRDQKSNILHYLEGLVVEMSNEQ